MSVEEKRELLKKANPSKRWAKQVDQMPPRQVGVAFKALKSQKKIKEIK